jgi:hypothetical protein
MLKQLLICAALIVPGTSSAGAQQQEAVLQKIEVPGAGFDIILAMPKPAGETVNLGNSPDALIVHLIGGELALSFDAEEKMLQALGSLRLPVCAFDVEGKDRKPLKPVAVYIVPTGQTIASSSK